MSNFHYDLMAQLDTFQKSGGIFTQAHYAIREALRTANMKAKQFTDVSDLIATVQARKPWLSAEAIKEAA